MEPIINSPFKFLDPYGRDDYNIFFGRDEEIRQLYQHIHKNRLVLVYGTSGTGKTSIVQCGLMNRMEDTDWTPFFIRRGDNINESLSKILKQDNTAPVPQSTGVSAALAGDTNMRQNTFNVVRAPSPSANDEIYESLKNVNLRYLRPVYLIFDQFEELLIMGSDTEKQAFIRIIDRILCDPELQFCNLLFIMREEFFAGLSEFEKEIPDFCDRRLRIEPMNARNVEEVIVKSCERFNITLKEGKENAKQIINVLTEKNTISLPYLQIYLDQLWRAVYMNSGPDIVFDSDIIRRFGKMNEVLNRFIRERITVIQEGLHEEFPDIPEDFVSNVLDGFVTNEGTKRPLAYLRINNGIWFTGQVAPYLQNRSSNLMIRCLSELEKNKILRTDGQTYELAHDVLAGLIDSRRTEEQRRAALIDQQIRSRFTGFQSKTSEYLTRKEIDSYRPFISQLNLAPEIIAFYTASIREREKEDLEKQEEIKRLKMLRERQKRWKWGWIAGGILAISSTALYFYSQSLRREFNRNESLVYMGYKMKNIDPVDALNLFSPIKDRVFGTDTNWVQQKLLEFMQTQEVQSKFSTYTDTLNSPILDPGHIDISASGQFIVVDNGDENYMVLDNKGKQIASFPGISYAYFLNRDDMLLLCRKTSDVVQTKKNNKLERYSPQTPFPTEFTLLNCSTGHQRVIRLGGAGRYLHPIENIAPSAFSEYDSYRVRYTASGNLIVPFLEKNNGDLAYTAQVMTSGGIPLNQLAATATITTSRDLKKIVTLYVTPEGNTFLHVYDEHGNFLQQLRGMQFGDFTEDGALIWGKFDQIHVLLGRDTLSFPTTESCGYAFGSLDKQRIIARMGAYDEDAELINLEDHSRLYFRESLLALNFEKNAFITHVSPVYHSEDKNYRDTIRRRNLNGVLTGMFIHPDGIETMQYNRAKDELLVLTKKNKLLLLDKSLNVKTGLQLTANDRYGIAGNGEMLYYVRDQFLSVFRNDMPYLDVFNAPKSWGVLAQKQSPVKREISKQRRKELGLAFR